MMEDKELPEPGATILRLEREGRLRPLMSNDGLLLKTHADLRSRIAPPWLIKKVLPSVGLASVYGPSGSGKSFLTMDMCAAIALGRPWFGHKTRQGNVLYCALEGAGGLSNRCDAWADHNDMDALPDNFRFCDASIDIRQDIQRICNVAVGCNVVVIDTLNQSAPGMDENSSQDMGDFIQACKQIQENLGCLVLIVHHTGKDQVKGMRGHSSLFAAMDAVIGVARGESGRSWSVTKSKEGEETDPMPFVLEVVKLRVDEDGDPVTSCIVRTTVDHTKSHFHFPRQGNGRLFYDELKKYAEEFGKPGQGLAPAGTNAVHREDAISVLEKHVASENRSARASIVRTLSGLIDIGALGFADDHYWCKK